MASPQSLDEFDIDFNSPLGYGAIGFLAEDDPYEASAFEVLRAKWINDSKMLYGEFFAAQADQSLK